MSESRGPLSHVKVLDLSRILAAPWAGDGYAFAIRTNHDDVRTQRQERLQCCQVEFCG